jgi:hypothetical protein
MFQSYITIIRPVYKNGCMDKQSLTWYTLLVANNQDIDQNTTDAFEIPKALIIHAPILVHRPDGGPIGLKHVA